MKRSDSAGPRERPAPPDDPGSAAAAAEVAVRILGGAAQSAAGLTRRLRQRGFTEQAAAEATAAMRGYGYLNDAAFANSIAARRQRTGHGRMHVGAELRARGLEPDAIAATLAAVDTDAERAAALELGRRFADRASRDIADRQGRQRLGGALQRRGFDSDTVGWVLRELDGERHS
ncbi:MAG: regulatory protein RecX [Candidatus Dormibacteraeota bacterium]|uniref:Regulatory protein RecX n=1 Tax=Candidatus Amunia macphersoniae TaxID=3127014 RepID=A0A934KR84_9BACT|nr:regulatory protein RecX [Candidatus Dormibacteraeota bacterium]